MIMVLLVVRNRLLLNLQQREILKQIKTAFDTDNIFNPGKIVDAVSMDKKLRYKADRVEPKIETLLDFSKSQDIFLSAENVFG